MPINTERNIFFGPRILINRKDLNITSYNLAIFIDREMSKQSFRVNEEKVLQCVGILWLWLKAISWKYTILFGLYSQSFIFLLQERRGKSKKKKNQHL